MAGINIFQDLVDFIFPRFCLVCGEPLTYHEETVCSGCLHHLPFTELPFSDDNPVTNRLAAKVKIYKATSLMIYHKDGASGKLIHALKYDGKTYVGKTLARYITPFLRSDMPDIIIPIPLHPKKLKLRGYNQLETFGRALAENLNSTYRDDILIKHLHTESQTSKSPLERWENVKKSFSVNQNILLTGEHILLIDDVLTTGSTLSAAAAVLHESFPEIKISIATMAFRWD